MGAPDGYTVEYDENGNFILVKNDEGGTTIPDSPTKKPEPTTKPEPTNKFHEPENPTHLIKTGQLNWPIPVLAVSGIFFIAIGWYLYANKKTEE